MAQWTRTASSLVQQHTFQKNEKSLNWDFVDLHTSRLLECMLIHAGNPAEALPRAQEAPGPTGARLSQTQERPHRRRAPFIRKEVPTVAQPRPSQTQRGPRSARPGPSPNACLPRQRPSYFTACLRAERTAASMALLVTVAPATPSMSAPWASSTCLAKVPSSMAS